MNKVFKLVLLLLITNLSACGWMRGDGACEDQGYTKAGSLPPLDVPADLDPPEQVAARKIPDVSSDVAEASRNCLVEPPKVLSARAEALANEPPKKSRKTKKKEGAWPTDEEALEDWVTLDPDKPGVLGSKLGTMHGIATKDVGEALQGWAQALSRKQLAPYFSYYSTGFRPEDGRKFKKWRKQREKELKGSGDIELSVYGMRARPVSQTRIQVLFFQRLKSEDVTQVIRKEVLLVREEGGWAIVRERSLGA